MFKTIAEYCAVQQSTANLHTHTYIHISVAAHAHLATATAKFKSGLTDQNDAILLLLRLMRHTRRIPNIYKLVYTARSQLACVVRDDI